MEWMEKIKSYSERNIAFAANGLEVFTRGGGLFRVKI